MSTSTPAGPKFTPGEWNVYIAGYGCCVYAGSLAEPQIIHDRSYSDEARANAYLFGASKLLLAAVKPLAFSDPENPPPGVAVEDWSAAVLAARAALNSVSGPRAAVPPEARREQVAVLKAEAQRLTAGETAPRARSQP